MAPCAPRSPIKSRIRNIMAFAIPPNAPSSISSESIWMLPSPAVAQLPQFKRAESFVASSAEFTLK